MAKIVKTQEVELGLKELIALLKKNWGLLAGFLTCNFVSGKKIVRVSASFNLVSVSNALNQTEGLVVDENELEEAIAQIFIEIGHQKPYYKNMTILRRITPIGLDISFDIDIVPVMPVEEPPSPLTTALLQGGDSPRCGSVLDDTDPEPIPEDGHL